MLQSQQLYERLLQDILAAGLPIDQTYFVVKAILHDLEMDFQMFIIGASFT